MTKSLIGVLLVSSLLLAETIELEPIQITADGFGNTTSTVSELEAVQSEVVIQETVPGFSQPIINGLMGDQVLLTLDGIKFSNSLFRSGPNQYYSWVPDEFTVKAEKDSKLGGITNSALGGSIDRTLGIDKSTIGLDSIDGDLSDTKTIVKYKGDTVQAGVVVEERGNVVTPDGEVQHSGYNQKAFYLGLRDDKIGNTKIVFSKSDDIDRTDKFEAGQYYVYDLQQYLLLTHRYWVSDTISITPSFQQFKEKIDRNDTTKNVDSTNNIYGINLAGYMEIPGLDGYVTYGLIDNFEDIDYTTGVTTNTYDYNVFSGYAIYHDSFMTRWDYDLKYKYSVMTAKGSGLDRTLDNHSVGFDTDYKFTLDHKIFASVDMSYKFPTITNLAEARDDSVTEIANPNLEQEKAITYKLGYSYNGFTTSVFYKDLYDMIIRTQTGISDGVGGYKWQYNNTNKGHIQGINVKYDRKFDNGFGIYAFAEYLEGRNDYDYWSKMTPFHSKVKASQDLKIFAKDTVTVEWLYAPEVDTDKMATKDQTDIRIQDHNYGYNIINVSYNVVSIDEKHEMSIGINNLFNKVGRVYGSSVDFPARALGLAYNFYY
jgi:hemoglobin/transferrin/lactoferrin receptor protein